MVQPFVQIPTLQIVVSHCLHLPDKNYIIES